MDNKTLTESPPNMRFSFVTSAPDPPLTTTVDTRRTSGQTLRPSNGSPCWDGRGCFASVVAAICKCLPLPRFSRRSALVGARPCEAGSIPYSSISLRANHTENRTLCSFLTDFHSLIAVLICILKYRTLIKTLRYPSPSNLQFL